ncbi:S8 family serine peptidase [Candidatus Bathyarchaeota archaeon]|nr:S8 family serine peptidase [Candidatus Bathyarchaeota archaeon]
MRKSSLSKLFTLILVLAIVVSCNLAAATSIFTSNNHVRSIDASAGNRSTVTSLAGQTLSPQTEYNWTASALLNYADNEGNLEVIVGVDNSTASYNSIAALTRENGGKIVDVLQMGENSALVVELSSSGASHFVNQVHSSGISSYIEPNGKYQVESTVNDPYWNLQWGQKRIGADYAWNTTLGSSDLLVAVIDTGIDYNHPDLKANYVPLGYDWINNDNDPIDDHGHGTHCAGIIAATVNNSIGVAGTAQVKIMAEKGLRIDGSGPYVALANCIIHATNVGADILSNSWGGGAYSDLIAYALAYANANGVLVLAAAGNENVSQPCYPGAYNDVIAVSATNTSDTKALFSNYGNWVDVAAPGVMIYSTMPTYHVTMNNEPRFTQTYSYVNGTSMACPMAAGVAALIWSKYPAMTAEFVREQLELTCDDIGAPGFDEYFGYGVVNAQRGVEQSPTLHDLAVKTWSKPSYAMLGKAEAFSLTTINRGFLDEVNVQVNLIVNGSVVNSTTIPSLGAYKTNTTVLTWTPNTIGNYNVTYAVTPSIGETNLNNNKLSNTYTVVAPPNPTNWTQIATNPETGVGYNLKAAYSQLDSGVVFFQVSFYSQWSKVTEAIDDVIMIDADQNVSTGLPSDYYPNQNNYIGADYLILVGWEGTEMWMWDQTNRRFDTSNPIRLLYLDAPDNSNVFVVGVSANDLPISGQFDCSFTDIALISDTEVVWDWMPDSGYVPFSPQASLHELTVTLDTLRMGEPNSACALTANVHNCGTAGESSVNLKLLINGKMVNSTSFELLASGQVKSVTYTWTPTEGYYNITAYATPVSNESNVADNARSRIIPVSQKIAVISDSSELWTTLNILDEMNINYDYYSNSVQIYTAQLSILKQYPVVVYYNNARNITNAEASALNGYLAGGGMLLVTGLDSAMYSDSKLARVARVIPNGDDYTENNLTVVESSHPIMNGPYGRFPAGYNVTNLNIDNDAVKADTARNATAVAKLSDGYAKIVVTESLPGKVVFWNGIGASDWLNNQDCKAMFKNTLLWFLDVSAPTTTADYDGLWHTTDFTINLSAYDYFGVNQTYYRINNGAIKTLSADGQPQITAESANNTLEYWSTDLYGHTETHQFLQQIKLDKTAPVVTLTINNGAKYSNTQNVNIVSNASDAFALSMRLSNDNSTWSTWETYTATKTWSLTSGDGSKTVYVQFRDEAGLTVSCDASILLDTTVPTANAGCSQTVNLGEAVAFDGSGSNDGNGIASYRWTFGDGATGTGVQVSNVYGSVGTFNVRLIVEDAAGNTASASVKVTVSFKPAVTPTPTPTATPTTEPTVTPTPTPTSMVTPTASSTETPMMGADNTLWTIAGVAVVAFCLGAACVFVLMKLRARPKL